MEEAHEMMGHDFDGIRRRSYDRPIRSARRQVLPRPPTRDHTVAAKT